MFASVFAIAMSAYFCLGAWNGREIFQPTLKRERTKKKKTRILSIFTDVRNSALD